MNADDVFTVITASLLIGLLIWGIIESNNETNYFTETCIKSNGVVVYDAGESRLCFNKDHQILIPVMP